VTTRTVSSLRAYPTGRCIEDESEPKSRQSDNGLDIRHEAIEFLQRVFQPAHPRFRFHWADIHNTFDNPRGTLRTPDYRPPAADGAKDLVFAASVFTHMLPENTAHYVGEAARVLRPGGRFVFSAFLLDHYRPGQPRPLGFARPDFDFDHAFGGHGRDFAVAFPDDPERMTAYSVAMLRQFGARAGLDMDGEPVPGLWSGAVAAPVGAQDLVVLRKPG
jgi:SAM-dependent methyltransferase